jgi:hypothetical protein
MLIGVALIPWIIRHPRSAAGALRGAHDNGPGRPVEDALRRIVVCLLRRVRVACGADHVSSNCEVAALAQIVGLELAWYRSIPADAQAIIRWQAQQADPPLQRLLTGWPMTCRAEVVGLGEVLFCHATPRHENELFTRLTPKDRAAASVRWTRCPTRRLRSHPHAVRSHNWEDSCCQCRQRGNAVRRAGS